MEKKKLVIAGVGKLGKIIKKAWEDGFLPEYELVAMVDRSEGSLKKALELKPDYIAEAASVQFVKDNAVNILSSGCNMIILSIGALEDKAFYEEVQMAAKNNDTKMYIASGAVGGFDVLRTIALMGEAQTKFRTKKGPASLQGTPLFEDSLMDDGEETHVFDGTADSAIKILPTKVNVSIAASLAASDPSRMKMDIYSVPGFAGDDHKITSEIDGVKAVIDIYSRTAEIAAWSVVSVLRNIVSPIVF